MVEGYLVDCLLAAERVVVELDGFAFHRTRAAHERDHERTIELQLRGYRVLRFTYRQVSERSGTVAAAVRTALAAS